MFIKMYFINSYILFFNGFNDIFEEILLRIGNGRFFLSGGIWDNILRGVKV